MALNQLRISGLLQAALVAVLMGYQLRGTSTPDPAATWPYVLGGYAFLAAVVPWLAGGLGRSDFSVGYSAILGVIVAAPVALGAWWLTGTPYFVIAFGFWVLVAFWVAHLGVAVVFRFQGPGGDKM